MKRHRMFQSKAEIRGLSREQVSALVGQIIRSCKFPSGCFPFLLLLLFLLLISIGSKQEQEQKHEQEVDLDLRLFPEKNRRFSCG